MDDGEYWSSYKVSVKLGKRWKLNLFEQFRMKHEMGNFYTYVQYVGPSFKVSDNFDIAIWHKLVSSKKNQEWKESHRFDIDGTIKLELGEVKLSDRSRFERNPVKSSWLYRNRLKFATDIEFFKKKFTPFISNEIFYDMDPKPGYHENRGSVGVSTDFIWGTKLTVYYMARTKKSQGDWTNANVLGTTVAVSF